MSSYCISCKSQTGDVNPQIVSGGRRQTAQCEECGARKSKFVRTKNPDIGSQPKRLQRPRKVGTLFKRRAYADPEFTHVPNFRSRLEELGIKY